MAKWADFLISGIWQSDGRITHVALRPDNDDTVGSATKRTEAYVIDLIKNKKTVKTIRWNYASAIWTEGALVTYEKVNGVEVLRTVPNTTKEDNLDNSFRMNCNL